MTTTTNTTPRKSKPGKVNLSPVREIPFNKLVLSQANVRRVKGGQSIEDLAEDIANRTLLQSLAVRPIKDEDGKETGRYEVPAGGRRFRALQLLVKQKRLARTAPVPCIVRADGSGAEDSLAENVHREALHPLDQFRAFQTLQKGGLSVEDIAARFFVTPAVVRQRLRLAAVSPKLLNLYAEGELTLEQLMAFTVSDDHARQEQAWETVSQHSWTRQPFTIRRLLTETAIPADDRRARFVGAEAYEAAGGIIMRDLFSEDDGGWFQDMTILERLVGERLTALAGETKAEGWAWVEAAPDFPYGHTNGMRALTGEPSPRTDAEEAERHSLLAEIDRILGAYGEGEDMPHADDRRVREIEARLEVLDTRPLVYDPVEMARAGAFISIAMDGTAHIERGYVRAGDEPRADAPEANPAEPDPAPETPEAPADPVPETPVPLPPAAESEPEDEGLRPLSDRLVSDLTAFRTLALREALGRSPDTAFLAMLHALCLSTFQPWAAETCLEINARSSSLAIEPPALRESTAATSFDARHAEWAARMPDDPADLWATLAAMSGEDRMALLAHCVSRSVHAVVEPWNRVPGRLRHADTLARAVGLDITAAGWQANAETYLNRVPKARILEAVREAKGERPAARIEHLRKSEMVKAAARLLEGTDWLPEPLRLPDPDPVPEAAGSADEDSPAAAAA